jgi:hypothetical protein
MSTLNIALALAVMCVLIAVTASALNAIVVAQSKTEVQRYNLIHGSAAKFRGSALDYGIPHVAMPNGKKTFPPELVPVP